jgi:hypothetical protein
MRNNKFIYLVADGETAVGNPTPRALPRRRHDR